MATAAWMANTAANATSVSSNASGRVDLRETSTMSR